MVEDLKTAVRALVASRSFTTVALVVLALGIGSATAIFSVVDAVVLRGLPFDEHDRLAAVLEKDTQHKTTFGEGRMTPQTYLDWRRLQTPFEHLAATASNRFSLKTENGEPADAAAQRVTWEFFPVLRVAPALGRVFNAQDEAEGHEKVAILSHGFWLRRFGGSPDVIGKTIELNDQSWEIVGVMRPDFVYPVGADKPAEILAPAAFTATERTKSKSHNFNFAVFGRLKPGLTLQQASRQMEQLSADLDRQFPEWTPGRRARVIGLHEHLVGRMRPWMLMLLGAVVLVLLIACANVANLLLARATVRAREMGIRAALGASPWQLVRALLIEGLVLSVAGAAIGTALAYGGVQVLRAWLPEGLPRVSAIALDLRVLSVAVGAAVVTGVFFGLVPALHSARPELAQALKDGGRSVSAGGTAHRLRNLLVIAEVALAVVLLVGAGLFTGSFARLMRVDPGFDYHNVIAFDVGLRLAPAQKFDDSFAARNAQYARQVLEAVTRAPGVQMAAEVGGGLPLAGSWSRTSVALPGRGELKGEGDETDLRQVTPAYLALMRVPLHRGRYIEDTDRQGTPPVVVVNEAAVQRYWPGQDPIGQHVKIDDTDREVIGIVGNIHHLGPETPPRQECYIPLAQAKVYGVAIVARTHSDPMNVVPAVKAAIWSVNREQRLTADEVTLERYMDRLIAQRRFNMAVLALFGILGLLIAAVGIYGVMAYVVAQRTNEIGLRMALGASRARVVGMVLQRAGLLLGLGLAIGGACAWYLSASVRTFLFEIQPADPLVFAAALAVLAAAALLASAIPARRAASVDPLVALRQE